jgi:acyl dehydratase
MTQGRELGHGKYAYDDVAEGDWLSTGARHVTADLIERFAALSGDRFAIHMSDDSARSYGFPGRVAHGILVLALVDGLKNEAPAQFDAIASLHWDWAFRAPVFIGDEIEARITVTGKRATRRDDRGILTLALEARNQRGEVVQSGTNKLMVHRRAAGR